MGTIEWKPEHEQDHTVSVVQRQRRRRCGVLSLGISGSEEAGRAAFERRGALARRKDRDHHHRTYGPANDVPQRWPLAGTYAGFLVLRRGQGPGRDRRLLAQAGWGWEPH